MWYFERSYPLARDVVNDRDFVFQMDPVKYQCLVFKNKTIVGPHSANDVKILFLPCHSGIFQCILNVSSWPVSADAETIVQAEALASRVVLTAVAENPHLEVSVCLVWGFVCVYLVFFVLVFVVLLFINFMNIQ